MDSGWGTARWLLGHGQPGEIATGDIGYVGYATNYPILDLLGLVDPVIAGLAGGYNSKTPAGIAKRFFSRRPEYYVMISTHFGCEQPVVPGSIAIFQDPRFPLTYEMRERVELENGFAWCIYGRRNP